ncbi:MAG: hypothetical protein J6Z12_07110 [Paludibacteraceae bacterium]|nr:hypothetical protein [Paludibacteraceae bacterium]
MKQKLTTIVLLCGAIWAQAAHKDAYSAYIQQDIKSWQTQIDSIRQQPNRSKQQQEQLLDLEYGFVAWALSETNNQLAQNYLDHSQNDLNNYAKAHGSKTRIQAYQSAFYAYEIKLHPARAARIGLRCISLAKSARRNQPDDYFAQIQYGNIQYFLPAVLGGSVAEAQTAYHQAEKIMERQGLSKHNWMYLNVLLMLADSYKQQGDYRMVQTYYEKILRCEPNFSWVRDTLIPANIKRLQ